MDRFDKLGIVKNDANFNPDALDRFLEGVQKVRSKEIWTKTDIVELFFEMIPSFEHKETGKYLDQRM